MSHCPSNPQITPTSCPRSVRIARVLALGTLLTGSALSALGVGDGLDLAVGGAGHVFFDLGAEKTDQAFACAALDDGRILMAGRASDDDGEGSKIALARLRVDGSLDPTFGNGGRRTIDFSDLGWAVDQASAQAVLVDDSGRYLVVGNAREIPGPVQVVFVTRLLADGSIDPTFLFNGIAGGWYFTSHMPQVTAAAIDATGYLWIVGPKQSDLAGDWAFVRLDASGGEFAIETIPVNGYSLSMPTAILFQPDHKAVIGGWGRLGAPDFYSTPIVHRLMAGGPNAVADPTFGFSGDGWIRLAYAESTVLQSLALLPDLKLVVAGASGELAEERLLVQRLTANGIADGSFEEYVTFDVGDPGGDGLGGQMRMVAQSDGKLILAARVATGDAGNNSDIGVVRLLTDHQPDPNFGGAGTGKRVFGMASPPPGNGDEGLGCLLLAGGRAVVVGWAEYIGLDTDFAYRRLENALIFTDGFESGWKFFWKDSANS